MDELNPYDSPKANLNNVVPSTSANGRCPRCDGNDFTRWDIKHPIIIHWCLNPGLVINELLLGQRIPKLQLLCKSCDLPLIERTYIPCPSCHVLHSGRIDKRSAFGRWRGTACPCCGERIPQLWNLFSLIIVIITAPIWFPIQFLLFWNKPLAPLYALTEDSGPPPVQEITSKKWVSMGLLFGSMMWLFMTLSNQGSTNGLRTALWTIPLAMAAGLFFGGWMWFFLGRKPRKSKTDDLP